MRGGLISILVCIIILSATSMRLFGVNKVGDLRHLHGISLSLSLLLSLSLSLSLLVLMVGVSGSLTGSSLGRQFGNYTLETNLPEHCSLISRTKQQRVNWRTAGVSALPR